MITSVTKNSNENLSKLRELTEKICSIENEDILETSNNRELIKEINTVIDVELKNIDKQISEKEKLKCYEKMFLNLKIMLSNFKFS